MSACKFRSGLLGGPCWGLIDEPPKASARRVRACLLMFAAWDRWHGCIFARDALFGLDLACRTTWIQVAGLGSLPFGLALLGMVAIASP